MSRNRDPILKTVSAGAFFVVNIFALYLLLRGHDAPGGGFIAGLASAISLVLLLLAYGPERTRRALRVEPVSLAAAGLALSTTSGLAPVVFGHPFLEQFTTYVNAPLLGLIPLGTPLAFDAGVYLLVVGITTQLVFALARSTQGGRALTPVEERRFGSPIETPIEENAPAGLDTPADPHDS